MVLPTDNTSALCPIRYASYDAALVARHGASLAYDFVLECLGQTTAQGGSASSSGGTTIPFVWTAEAIARREGQRLFDNFV